MNNTEFSIEEAFLEVEKVIEKLQNPETALEDALKEYQKGVALLKGCSERIDQVEKQVVILNEGDAEET